MREGGREAPVFLVCHGGVSPRLRECACVAGRKKYRKRAALKSCTGFIVFTVEAVNTQNGRAAKTCEKKLVPGNCFLK